VFLTEGNVQVLKEWLVLLVATCLLCCSACEYEVPVSISVGAGPSFAITTGSDRLVTFSVYAPLHGERIAAPHPDVAVVVWEIKAINEDSSVEGSRLVYGKIPEGYKQVVPSQSQTPPPLPVGAAYSFYVLPAEAQPLGGYFYMDKTGPIQIRSPDICLTLIKGREARVKCGTNEPYQEPKDLEEMVRRNRIGP